MLHSLDIHNYRNLRHLTIGRLRRVNLLLGKNNTGKTSVLEAASILIQKANPQWLYQILDARGEMGYEAGSDRDTYLASNVQAIANLFYGRQAAFDVEEGLKIQQVLTNNPEAADIVMLSFGYYLEELNLETDQVSITHVSDNLYGAAKIGLEVATTISSRSRIVTLNRRLGRPMAFSGLKDNIQFIRTNEIIRETNGILWDKITLTPKQEFTIDALRIVEPDIESLNFVAGQRRDERRPKVKLAGSDLPIILSSMGDGINRILTIILAMVNCEDGYLLIDEFENGLHYSVQEKLWEVIFSVAERLNIQVFATTHSYDCVKAFSHVLNDGKYSKESGCMFRLDNYDGKIEATLYDADEIETTVSVDVDPR